MSPHEALTGAARRLGGDAKLRWTLYLFFGLFFGIFALFPRPYVALARVMPQDTSGAAGTTNLMMMLGGQSATVGSILSSGRASADVYAMLARSDMVNDTVIQQLGLLGPGGYSDHASAKRALARKVDVSMLLGGVMQIEAKTHNPDESERLAKSYVFAINKALTAFGAQTMANKARIIERRFPKAAERVAQSEMSLEAFRRKYNLPMPEEQLGTNFAKRTALESQLQAKEVELSILSQFNGPENQEVKAAQAEIATLRQQIARAAEPSMTIAGPNLASAGSLETQYINLYRDYKLAQSIYEVYARTSEQIAVDRLSAETASYIQIVDAPYLDIYRHYNIWAVSGFALVLLTILFVEIYGPLSGLFNLYAAPQAYERSE